MTTRPTEAPGARAMVTCGRRSARWLGVAATSRAIYQSPAFTYRGAGGLSSPTDLVLRRRTTLEPRERLAVGGNSADYSVDLVDITQGGSATNLINDQPIGAQNSWVAKSVSPAPASLTLGDRYRVRIRSVFLTGAQVVPGGSVGYDDVVLRGQGQGTWPSPRRRCESPPAPSGEPWDRRRASDPARVSRSRPPARARRAPTSAR